MGIEYTQRDSSGHRCRYSWNSIQRELRWLCMVEKSSDGRGIGREISRQIGRGHIRKVFFSIIHKNLKLIPNLDLGDILKYLSHPTIS